MALGEGVWTEAIKDIWQSFMSAKGSGYGESIWLFGML